MKFGYKSLFGKCVDCIGCNRLELINFNGVYKCSSYVKTNRGCESNGRNKTRISRFRI